MKNFLDLPIGKSIFNELCEDAQLNIATHWPAMLIACTVAGSMAWFAHHLVTEY